MKQKKALNFIIRLCIIGAIWNWIFIIVSLLAKDKWWTVIMCLGALFFQTIFMWAFTEFKRRFGKYESKYLYTRI